MVLTLHYHYLFNTVICLRQIFKHITLCSLSCLSEFLDKLPESENKCHHTYAEQSDKGYGEYRIKEYDISTDCYNSKYLSNSPECIKAYTENTSDIMVYASY